MADKKKFLRLQFNAAGKRGKIALGILATGLGIFAVAGYRHTPPGQRANDEALWHNAMSCQAEAMQDPALRTVFSDWLAQFNDCRNLSLEEKALVVDDAVNRLLTYQTDETQFKVPDRWAAPYETVLSGKGDCDDYAVLKHHVLTQYLNVDPSLCQIATAKTGAGGHVFVLLNFGTAASPDYGVLDNGTNGHIYKLEHMTSWELRDICDGTSFKPWLGPQPGK